MSLDGFQTPIIVLHSADQYLYFWLPFVGLYSGIPEIAWVLLLQVVLPHKHELRLPHGWYESVTLITDWILRPTDHPLWALQTSTVSVLEKQRSWKVARVHHLVLLGIDLSYLVGYRVVRIHILIVLLLLQFHERLYLLQFSCHPGKYQEWERNSLPVFWTSPGFQFLTWSCYSSNRMV